MKDLRSHKAEARSIVDHPYNREPKESPGKWQTWFRYAVRIILLLVVAYFVLLIIQGENVFDVIGGFFQSGMQSW